ncbi:UTP--glucose-1-phosphate uridylyltransferase GalU [Granulicella tundricola]|uniref:UTP--glucose-1-phosphate uridylyltransferase n=1 Tax=Granulicella tundricola (strain ATCC BAA-1859 / DSM 23138 / MP5ACTX9) TaxID=1198114 RepID=E8WWU4_GRATM|nr:UTP--glucose-1-phosphate uridylyltransferase GalU [Granulicella tundricola]ADW67422.1 UTP-glucose-1-phosphate uridylyltransferase [Granulicella tundricola MP5ACTX9]
MTPKKIRKAVFPAAGLGTRFLPATKATPKEMLCLVDKPLIQYGVEEAVAAGCTEIIIITSRGKTTMEDHFDSNPELEASLAAKNKTALLEIARSVSKLAKITFTRQSQPLGLGHAVLMAKEIVGDEPFAVLLPDDIVDADTPCMKQMVEAFNETQCSILGSEVVEGDAISAYGCLDCSVEPSNPRLLAVKGMVEKPKPGTQPSQNAIIGRYILTPRIFEMIEHITPGAGGELQLTDAIKALLQHEKVYGFSYEGKRHDAGDKQGFLRATVELALKHPQLGPDFRTWLKNFPA